MTRLPSRSGSLAADLSLQHVELIGEADQRRIICRCCTVQQAVHIGGWPPGSAIYGLDESDTISGLAKAESRLQPGAYGRPQGIGCPVSRLDLVVEPAAPLDRFGGHDDNWQRLGDHRAEPSSAP